MLGELKGNGQRQVGQTERTKRSAYGMTVGSLLARLVPHQLENNKITNVGIKLQEAKH